MLRPYKAQARFTKCTTTVEGIAYVFNNLDECCSSKFYISITCTVKRPRPQSEHIHGMFVQHMQFSFLTYLIFNGCVTELAAFSLSNVCRLQLSAHSSWLSTLVCVLLLQIYLVPAMTTVKKSAELTPVTYKICPFIHSFISLIKEHCSSGSTMCNYTVSQKKPDRYD